MNGTLKTSECKRRRRHVLQHVPKGVSDLTHGEASEVRTTVGVDCNWLRNIQPPNLRAMIKRRLTLKELTWRLIRYNDKD